MDTSEAENANTSVLENALRELTTRYWRTAGRVKLSVFVTAVASTLDAMGRKYAESDACVLNSITLCLLPQAHALELLCAIYMIDAVKTIGAL